MSGGGWVSYASGGVPSPEALKPWNCVPTMGFVL